MKRNVFLCSLIIVLCSLVLSSCINPFYPFQKVDPNEPYEPNEPGDPDCYNCGECETCDPVTDCNDCGVCEICDPIDLDFTFNVSNEAQWLEARAAIATGGNGKSYAINITGNFSLPGDTDTNDWDTFGTVTGITILIRGTYTITLNDRGWFMVINSGQNVVMRDLNLKGFSSNGDSVVYIDGRDSKAEFIMEGVASISGNNLWGMGGGVNVLQNLSFFTMQDNARVYDNSATYGGGVYIDEGATFIIRDNASVYDNTADYGGGVNVGGYLFGYNVSGTSFTMQGNSSVTNNTATASGGGVYVASGGTFTRSGSASVTNNSSAGTGRNIGPYEIGDTGPGGGKIFYAVYTAEGFTVQGTGSGNTGVWPDSYRAHYLEADTGTINLTWAPTTSPAYNIVEGTSLDIGTGRRNTALILAAAGANPATNAPAANFCVTYGTPGDWFLPSYYEIFELTHYMINYSPGDIVIDDTHWTSSQGLNATGAEQHSLGNTTIYGSLAKFGSAKVRPIRAF